MLMTLPYMMHLDIVDKFFIWVILMADLISWIKFISSLRKNLNLQVWNGVLFWPSMKKNCCSGPGKFLKFEVESWEFKTKYLFSLSLEVSHWNNHNSNCKNYNLEIWRKSSTSEFPNSDYTEVGRAPLIHFQKIFFQKGFL